MEGRTEVTYFQDL